MDMTANMAWAKEIEKVWGNGDLNKVEHLCQQALSSDDTDPLAHYILGKLYIENNKIDQGIPHLVFALHKTTYDLDALSLLGKAFLIKEKWLIAGEYLQNSLQLAPNNSDSLYHLGIAQQNQEEFSQAATSYLSALALRPDLPLAHGNLGYVYTKLALHQKAIDHYQKALSYTPDDRELTEKLIESQINAGQHLSAVNILRHLLTEYVNDTFLPIRILEQEFLLDESNNGSQFTHALSQFVDKYRNKEVQGKPRITHFTTQHISNTYEKIFNEAHFNSEKRITAFWYLADLFSISNQPDKREDCLLKIIGTDENFPALLELGTEAFHKKKFIESEGFLKRALQIDPNHVDTLNALGALNLTGKEIPNITETILLLKRATELPSISGLALHNLGLAYFRMSSDPRALPTLRHAVELEPENALIHNSLSMVLLSSGQLDEGWQEYEWRLKTDFHRVTPYTYPTWSGQALENKTILVCAEQGLGDEILFASCIPDLIKTCKQCIMTCDARLIKIFQRSFPNAIIIGQILYDNPASLKGLPVPDYQIPAGSLAKFFRKSISDFPAHHTFLKADPMKIKHWKSRLGSLGEGPKIGFSWKSGKEGYGRAVYPRLNEWQHLFEHNKNCFFINIQYDDTTEQRTELRKQYSKNFIHFEGIDFRNDINNLSALISALDLIITMPNINAPIAGSLGRPIWRLSSGPNDTFRLNEKDYPWFPSTTLLSQTIPGQGDLLTLLSAWLRKFEAYSPQSEEVKSLLEAGFISKAGKINKNDKDLALLLSEISVTEINTNRGINFEDSEAVCEDMIYPLTKYYPKNTRLIKKSLEKILTREQFPPEIIYVYLNLILSSAKNNDTALHQYLISNFLPCVDNYEVTLRRTGRSYFELGKIKKAWHYAKLASLLPLDSTIPVWEKESLSTVSLVIDSTSTPWLTVLCFSILLKFIKNDKNIYFIVPENIKSIIKKQYPKINTLTSIPKFEGNLAPPVITVLERIGEQFLGTSSLIEKANTTFHTPKQKMNKKVILTLFSNTSDQKELTSNIKNKHYYFDALSNHLSEDDILSLTDIPSENLLEKLIDTLSGVSLFISDSLPVAAIATMLGGSVIFYGERNEQLLAAHLFPHHGKKYWMDQLLPINDARELFSSFLLSKNKGFHWFHNLTFIDDKNTLLKYIDDFKKHSN